MSPPLIHAKVAATLTDAFLDFSAARGNNLRSINLRAGNKWCLCAGRWREAMEYAREHEQDASAADLVPKVHLHATNVKALDVLDMKDLSRFAAPGEAGNASTTPQSRKGNAYPGGVPTRETTELAGKGGMTSAE